MTTQWNDPAFTRRSAGAPPWNGFRDATALRDHPVQAGQGVWMSPCRQVGPACSCCVGGASRSMWTMGGVLGEFAERAGHPVVERAPKHSRTSRPPAAARRILARLELAAHRPVGTRTCMPASAGEDEFPRTRRCPSTRPVTGIWPLQRICEEAPAAPDVMTQ